MVFVPNLCSKTIAVYSENQTILLDGKYDFRAVVDVQHGTEFFELGDTSRTYLALPNIEITQGLDLGQLQNSGVCHGGGIDI
jgi:hypothetical protein